MSTLNSLIIILFTILIGCTGTPEEAPPPSINDIGFRNGKFLWWESSDGDGEWIKIDDKGKWSPSNGMVTKFYDNGEVKLIKTYLNNETTGPYKAWNKNGELVISGKLTNNQPDSIFQIFHRNGQVRAKYFMNQYQPYPYQVEIYSRKGAKTALFNLERSNKGNFLKGNQYIFYPNGNPKIKYENNVRTVYSEKDTILNQTNINVISLHYPHVVLALFTYYVKIENCAEPVQEDYGCIYGDCENGLGTYSYEMGALYSGDFKNGFLNGNGSVLLVNSDTLYSGNFLHGMFHGYGTFYGQYEKYSGQFKRDLYNGFGEIEYSDGSKYTGQFVNDLFNGKGTYIDVDGRKYTGIWKDGEFVE